MKVVPAGGDSSASFRLPLLPSANLTIQSFKWPLSPFTIIAQGVDSIRRVTAIESWLANDLRQEEDV